jgi:hypothetical protein
MRARALFMPTVILVLIGVACRPQATPTLDAAAVETAVAQTVQAQLAAETAEETAEQVTQEVTAEAAEAEGEPEDRPPGTSSPEPTSTPLPAATDTPVPSPTQPPATATPTPRPTPTRVPCPIGIAPEFEPRLSARPDVLGLLGCPAGDRQPTWAAEQSFQHGRMFWQADTDLVSILFDASSTFWVEPDRYVEGDPDDICPDAGAAPEGLFKPVRGFNWHWCNTPNVRASLGWALEQETGYDALWQPFESGYVLQSHANHLFVFYANGSWGYLE